MPHLFFIFLNKSPARILKKIVNIYLYHYNNNNNNIFKIIEIVQDLEYISRTRSRSQSPSPSSPASPSSFTSTIHVSPTINRNLDDVLSSVPASELAVFISKRPKILKMANDLHKLSKTSSLREFNDDNDDDVNMAAPATTYMTAPTTMPLIMSSNVYKFNFLKFYYIIIVIII